MFKPTPHELDEIVAATSALVIEALSVSEVHPVTEDTPLAHELCKGYTAWFAVARPGSTLGPVSYETGDRAYLPLIVLGESYFRVGDEVRSLHPGEILVFDKRQTHSAQLD